MEKLLIVNGIIILFEGLVGGYAFSKAITKTPEREVAWRVVHSGGCMAGIMLLAFAGIWEKLHLGTVDYWLGLRLIGSNHLFMVAMFAAAITGKRGLKSDSTGTEKTIFWMYTIAALVSILTFIGLIVFSLIA